MSRQSLILIVGENSQYFDSDDLQTNCSALRKLEFLPFFKIGTPSAIPFASAEYTAVQIKQKEKSMSSQSTFANKLAAAASAFLLSVVLISGTVSMPQTAHAQTIYVGEIA